MFVCSFRAVTLAPGILAPLGSLTTPVMEEVPTCAPACRARSSAATKTVQASVWFHRLFMLVIGKPPLEKVAVTGLAPLGIQGISLAGASRSTRPTLPQPVHSRI